ncbi:MAG: apolipoprotein N-acyltransferase [Candidatus Omnitrophota bacterium]
MFLSFFLCFISAGLLILSFPPADFYFLIWVGFVPLFFALEDKNIKQAFFLSYLWGLIFWGVLIYWLMKVTLVGYVFLALYLALYSGIFGIIFLLVPSSRRMLVLPSAWVVIEFIRTYFLSGFGWALLGYSQYKNLFFIQIADITGVYGVSFLIILFNLTIYSLLSIRHSMVDRRRRIVVSLFIFLFVFLYGYYRVTQRNPGLFSRPFRISLIQANISPYEKWDEELKNEIIERYIYLTQRAVKKNSPLIIWPETAFPGFWNEERELREKTLNLAKEIKTGILVGAPIWEEGVSYNSAILISSEGEEMGEYRKIRLVPFGEYIPFPRILGFLRNRFNIGDYSRGKEYKVFAFPSLPDICHFSVLICFEDIFPDLTRRFVKKGAEFLINITEDGWYGKTSASFQHLQALVFRAVENRRYMVRAANTGYSCVINPQGRIISELKDDRGEKLFISGVHTSEIFPNSEITFYNRFGDWFIVFSTIVFLIFLL